MLNWNTDLETLKNLLYKSIYLLNILQVWKVIQLIDSQMFLSEYFELFYDKI